MDFPCHPGNRFPPLTLLTSCVSQTVMEIGFLLPNVQLPTRQCWDGAHLRPLSSHVFRALGNYFYSHKRHWHLSLLLRPFRVLFFSSPAINGCSFRIVDLSTLSFSILPTEESGNLLNLSLSLDLLYIYRSWCYVEVLDSSIDLSTMCFCWLWWTDDDLLFRIEFLSFWGITVYSMLVPVRSASWRFDES